MKYVVLFSESREIIYVSLLELLVKYLVMQQVDALLLGSVNFSI